MTILEMIAEWRKGCSIAGHRGLDDADRELGPECCPACTVALIESIESKVRREGEANASGHDELMERLRLAHEACGLLRSTRAALVEAICNTKPEWYQFPPWEMKCLEHAIDAAQLRPPMTKEEAGEAIENLKRILAARRGDPFTS
jgi:hypothetical protein